MTKSDTLIFKPKALNKNDFQLVMLPFSSPRRENAQYYRKSAACWEEVWLELFQQSKIDQPLFLDHLLRQDEAACLFTPTACVGMILFRTIDFSILNFQRDSYFKEWSSADIQLLLQHGPRAFLATYLTVHPNFRHYSPDFKFKEVLLDIMIKRFKASDADVISGITRRDRGIHDESYKLGASLIHENVDYMNGHFKVDLVGFYRKNAVESANPKVREISDLVWQNRLDISHQPIPYLNAA